MKQDLKSSCQKQTKSRSTTSKTHASKQYQKQSKLPKLLLDTSNKLSSPSSKRSAKSRAIEALANKKINSKKSSLANATANKSTVDLIGKTNSSESNTNDLDELEEELSDQEINKSFIEDDNEDEDSDKYEENIDISDEEEEEEEEELGEELEENEESRLFRPFKKIKSSAREKSGSSDFSNASARKHANNISHTETTSTSDLETEPKSIEKYRLRKQSNSSNRSLSNLESFPTTSSRAVVPNKKARLSTDLPWNVYSPGEIEKSK